MPYLYETRSYLIRALIFLAVLALIGYALFEARHLIGGPSLALEHTLDGVTQEEPIVRIAGTARNISHIWLNDRPIFVDETGRFEEKLVLPVGYTIMTLRAEDRFGRETEKITRFVHNPQL